MQKTYGSKHKKSKGKGPKYGKKGIEASNGGYKRKYEKHDGKKDKNMNYSIMVNLVTLLVIVLSQRLRSNQPHSKRSNNLCGILLNFKGK
jgi:hypothetical protein